MDKKSQRHPHHSASLCGGMRSDRKWVKGRGKIKAEGLQNEMQSCSVFETGLVHRPCTLTNESRHSLSPIYHTGIIMRMNRLVHKGRGYIFCR